MFFIAGVSPRLKQLGSVPGVCAACGYDVDLHIIKQSQTISLFFVPLIPIGGQYLATCPRCASVMQLDKSVGKAVESGRQRHIPRTDQQTVKNNVHRICPHCRARTEPGQNFCPQCGERL